LGLLVPYLQAAIIIIGLIIGLTFKQPPSKHYPLYGVETYYFTISIEVYGNRSLKYLSRSALNYERAEPMSASPSYMHVEDPLS
jgi:hypothetical protein